MNWAQEQLLSSLGVTAETKRSVQDQDNWDYYSLNHNSKSRDVPIFLVESGPRNIADIKRKARSHDTCVMISPGIGKLFIKTLGKTHTVSLDSETEYYRIAGILKANNVGNAQSEIELNMLLESAIEAIPSTAGEFENRGLFSTHYLRNRIFDDAPDDADIPALRKAGTDMKNLLDILGWKIDDDSGTARVITTSQENFSIRESEGDVAPSYTAVSTLSDHKWVILTNGTKWRLYTSRVSASSTNYFELSLHEPSDTVLRYLWAIFRHSSFEGTVPKIDLFFDKGKEFATQLEEDLASRIMSQDGALINLAKGVLGHDMKTKFSEDELTSAKESALRIIYRVWFVAYAEARNLLPVEDKKYADLSLRSLRGQLDKYEQDSSKYSCWKHLSTLFEGIRNGSPENNLPQYNGNLFERVTEVDGIKMENRWLVPALRDLLERNEESVDFASLSVRHLGNILENVMEFSIQQAKEDIMLLVDKGKMIQVKTKRESNYSYQKNNLYLASKGGIVVRKSTASYYTPDEIVIFLVERGLKPILDERTKKIAGDIRAYKKEPSKKNRSRCMDRLLDIQVLDPTMGSGHFLVEALNRLTSWATEMLKKHPAHPLLEELEEDRETILKEQKDNGITLDANLLTHEVLLKRRIMKRCIFGVDLNPMAVEIAKLALWLDSFAIGVPLTYMDHHIKAGDSTIGMFLDDLKDHENQSLDDWMPSTKSNTLIENIASSSDVTISQVHESEGRYAEYEESISPFKRMLDALTASVINGELAPKKSKMEFIHRFAKYAKNEDRVMKKARKTVREISERRKFFHWELEMRDAFTDSRNGFDVILGNPPWDKSIPNDDDFAPQYYPAFRSLSPKPKKNEIMALLLKDSKIKSEYDIYHRHIKEKNNFYSTYQQQGVGHKELQSLIIERSLELLSDGGMLSMVMPSQILSSDGSADIRDDLLKKDIHQIYVFENRKKIFNIDSRYRFVLLTIKNSKGGDKFPVGFYLHNLTSLKDQTVEKEKFGEHSKNKIRTTFPESFVIPESTGVDTILEKMYKHLKLRDGLAGGFEVLFSSGFNRTNDSDLFREDGRGLLVHEGKTIHQYNNVWSNPKFTTLEKIGLERENKPKYGGKHRQFYNSYRLVFRNISSPTNMRTIISTIIPPKTFHTHALSSVIIKQDDKIILGYEVTYLYPFIHKK